MKIKRILFWALLFLFIIACIWWIFYFPYNQERLYRAIPENAIFISEHENLAKRRESFIRSPMARIILAYFHIEPEAAERAVKDPVVARMINRLAAKNTLVAYVPSINSTEKFQTTPSEAWVAASWVGSYGQLLRWGLLRFGLDLKTIRFDNGKSAWIYDDKTDGYSPISIAVTEGVLFVCYSRDPAGVRYLVRRIDKKAALNPLIARAESQLVHNALDHGRIGDYNRETNILTPILQFDLIENGKNGAEGLIFGSTRLSLGKAPDESNEELVKYTNLKTVSSVLGNLPSAILTSPFTLLDQLSHYPKTPKGLKTVMERLQSIVAGDTAFISAIGGDYSGRLFVRVPALMAGLSVEDGNKALDIVPGLLDSLNAEYGWGLIPRQTTIGNMQAIVLERAMKEKTETIYDKFVVFDNPVVVAIDDWLIFSSSDKSLEKILTAREGVESGGKTESIWLKSLCEGASGKTQPASAYAWIDFQGAEQDLRNARAAFTLATMASLLSGKKESETSSGQEANKITAQNAGIKILEDIMICVESLRPFKTCSVWLTPSASGYDARFRIGEQAVGQ